MSHETRDSRDLLGIVEFFDWMHVFLQEKDNPLRRLQREACRRAGVSVEDDISQVHACLAVHRYAGIDNVAWSLGRSTVQYHSKDRRITRQGDHSDEAGMNPSQIGFKHALEKECFLRSALEFGHAHGMTLVGHLCMNRHYGGAHGNNFSSLLSRRPELREKAKDGSEDGGRLCFAMPEYREERLAIVRETVELGLDAICLDFVRQPPMMRYHPALVDPYLENTGVDPRKIDPAKEPEVFLEWCRYRAGVLTEFMREVRWTLREIEMSRKRRIPLHVRITDCGFTANLISGIDIETWCREGLVDCVLTHPLQWINGIWTHDVQPYVELGRRTGVKIFGGVNTYAVQGWQMNPVCIARRIKYQYEAGVAGMSLYETNDTVIQPAVAELLAAMCCYDDLAALLENKTWLAQWPVNGLNANCGMDNHSALYPGPLWSM